MIDFCHLHIHNEYSLLDGLGTAEQYAIRTKELGQKYIALTNHGNVDGVIKFQRACDDGGIVPIIGCELYIVPNMSVKVKGEKRYHITVLVENDSGWKNLLKMITVSHLDGFYRKPRVDYKLFIEYCKGLVVLTGCSSSFLFEKKGIQFYLDLLRILPDSVYLELMPNKLKSQIDANEICISLNKEYGTPFVATNDCHYVLQKDVKAQEVLLAIQRKAKWKDPDRWKFDLDSLYLMSSVEMIRAFRSQEVLDRNQYENAIKNTISVAEKCSSFRIKKQEVSLPVIKDYSGKDSDILKKVVGESFDRIIKGKVKNEKIYEDRLVEELGLIIDLGFSRYFLIVYELMDWCKKNNILTGIGRGSVGGSLVAYLLGITAVDPIKYDLLFARFISPARIDLPDIDMDFEDRKRNLVKKHFQDLYGEYCVAGCATFLALHGRGAVRDVARVFDVPLVNVNKACKSIVVRSGGDFRADFTIEDAFNTFEDGIDFKKKYPEVTDIAIRLEGQIRGGGQHAAAVVVSSDDLRDGQRASLQKGKNELIVNWDKHDLEYVGLMKLDILGLNALTILSELKEIVSEKYDKKAEFCEIDLCDEKVLSEFSKGHCIGIFQFNSLGLRRLCRELIIDNFEMLVHANALHRPGTIRSGMMTSFIHRKHGREKWEHKHKAIEKITKDTYGVILYQEQVMNFMYELGGLQWKTADVIRKVISKSQGVEQFMKFGEMFAEGCVKKGTLGFEDAKSLWQELSSFGSYGFNKAHAVEYSLIAFWMMYFKVYHPLDFICVSLTYGNENKIEEMVEDIYRLGLKLRLPKLGISDAQKWIEKDGIIYVPFIAIKGFGEKSAKKVLSIKKETDGFFDIMKSFGRSVGGALENIQADMDIDIEQDKIKDLQKYFAFNIDRDRSHRFKKMIELISLAVKFEKVNTIDFSTVDMNFTYYFGEMTEVKYGYRDKMDTLAKKIGASGTVDSLGGVYGNFADDTDFVMLVFEPKFYDEKKMQIEHCAEEFLLVKSYRPNKTSSIFCNYAWFEEDLKTCALEGLDLNIFEEKLFRNISVVKCSECELRSECRSPVLPSCGRINAFIVGEAPGVDEDLSGKPFVGKASDILWSGLKKYNFCRDIFHVTNVVKCFPSKTKTPTGRQISHCSKFLDSEIERLEPPLIFAMGNTSLKYFTSEDSGIMAKNATTEWNEKFGAWICYCIHPASVLYHKENQELFDLGVKNFIDKFKILGGDRWLKEEL